MNRYSLGSESRLWWLPAGAAGAVAAGVLAVPLLPSSGSVPAAPSPPAVSTPDVQRGYAHIPYRHCPPPPDPKYVGVPWVAPHSECRTLRSWWRYVD